MNQKTNLDDKNIGKLLFKLSFPATVGMMVMSFYNVVDTIFIGQGVGTDGIGGVVLSFPIQMVVGAVGQMIGIGGASLFSRSLGENNFDKARKTLGTVTVSVLVLGAVITAVGYAKLNDLLRLFGATNNLLPYAREYLTIVLAGTVFHTLSMALNNIARAEGKAKIAMTTMIISAVVNILLDAVFIFGFNMGIKGAALATLIAYISAAVFLIAFFQSGKSVLPLRIRNIVFDLSVLKEIVVIGIASFIRQTAMSFLIILLNRRLGQLGGDIAIALFGVVMRLIMFIFTPIMGIARGLQPVAGFNYGAQRFDMMKKSVIIATVASTSIAVSGTLLLTFFPATFLSIFSDDQELINQGRIALRYIILAFPLVGFQVMGSTLFQATGKAVQTLVLALARQLLLLIPLILILPQFFHLTGLWIAFPIADTLGFFLAVFMVYRFRFLYRVRPETAVELKK